MDHLLHILGHFSSKLCMGERYRRKRSRDNQKQLPFQIYIFLKWDEIHLLSLIRHRGFQTKSIFPIFSYNLVIGKNCTRLLANRKGTLGLPSSSNSKLLPCCQYHVQSSCTLISACIYQHIRSETYPNPIWSKIYHHSPCLFVLGSNLMKHCTNINIYGNTMFKKICNL